MDHADKILWGYLIRNGSVLESEGYYGNSSSAEKTEKLRDMYDRAVSAFDWGKTKPVIQDTEYKFNGTFADDMRVLYLKGVIFVSGVPYTVYLELDDMTVKDVIADVLLSQKAG